MKKNYEVEKCECGHIAPLEFVSHDDDGNGTCYKCLVEELFHQLKNKKEKDVVASIISGNPLLNEVCRFGDIEQGKFFIYENVKLCKFGCYGMGIDANGTVAKKLSDDTEVVKANFI